MIIIDKVDKIPLWDFMEVLDGGKRLALEYYSKKLWLVWDDDVPLFLAGLYQPSLLDPPEFWLALTKTAKGKILFALAGIKAFLRVLAYYHPGIVMRVEEADKKAKKLVTVMGLTPFRAGTTYTWYRI